MWINTESHLRISLYRYILIDEWNQCCSIHMCMYDILKKNVLNLANIRLKIADYLYILFLLSSQIARNDKNEWFWTVAIYVVRISLKNVIPFFFTSFSSIYSICYAYVKKAIGNKCVFTYLQCVLPSVSFFHSELITLSLTLGVMNGT